MDGRASLPSLGLLDVGDEAVEGLSELGFEEVALGGEVVHVDEVGLELLLLVAEDLQVVLLAVLVDPHRHALHLLLENVISHLR